MDDLKNMTATDTTEHHLPDAEVKKVPTIKISKSHFKFLSKRQGKGNKLKIIRNNKPEQPTVWERRGQTFEQYQKREPRVEQSQPERIFDRNSVTQRKILARINGAKSRNSTRPQIIQQMVAEGFSPIERPLMKKKARRRGWE